MISIHGKGVSDGVALGAVHFFRRADRPPEKKKSADPGRECARLAEAQEKAAQQLNRLAEACRAENREDAASLFDAHAFIAADEDLTRRMKEILLEESCTAEYAAHLAGEEFSARFAALSDPYMQARAADVADVARRIIRLLTGAPEETGFPASPFILAADDLAPSETLRLGKSGVLGFLTRKGSSNSHTAILARSMGLPAICGAGDALSDSTHGHFACMDGKTGEIILDPDDATRLQFADRRAHREQELAALAALTDAQDVTPGGKQLPLYANIGSAEEIEAALQCGAQGIGLFRSEFLFLNRTDYPTEDMQFEAYRAAASALNGKRVVIRTLDAGADKQADYLNLTPEQNPALGLRGIRLCLSRPDLFRTQLRALYRASAFGNIAIMFPMITAVREVKESLALCREVMEELRADGIPFRPETEIGVMIETPAAALIAEDLARITDFFSVGTNDLTQYTLACDRQNEQLETVFEARHPALIRLVRMAAKAAHEAGIWIGVCGELAADSALLPEFLDMEIDELSVSPASILPLRAQIRSFQG